MASANKLASESELQASVEMPSDCEVVKANEQSIKRIAAILHTPQTSEKSSDASESKTDELTQMTDQPPLIMPIFYSINKIEVLQTL